MWRAMLAATDRKGEAPGMDEVTCLVQVWDRGQTRRAEVTVSAADIRAKCWRTLACTQAAVMLEMPFPAVAEKAKFWFRQEDKERYFGKRDAGQSP